jgi:hypothetical protein
MNHFAVISWSTNVSKKIADTSNCDGHEPPSTHATSVNAQPSPKANEVEAMAIRSSMSSSL